MTLLYELVVLGAPSAQQVSELKGLISDAISLFGMSLGKEVVFNEKPNNFTPKEQVPTAAVFFGGQNASTDSLLVLLNKNIPVLPVVSNLTKVSQEIPEILRPFNCLDYGAHGMQRVATASLECVGLLPRQRRVFVSYKREDARQAALQLFDELSSRHFDVFLDTHGISLADDFQAMLWHRLCDSDVLIMLDTENYFSSRWTSAEFGRALAKGISILRVGWPGFIPSPRLATASSIDISDREIDTSTGMFTSDGIKKICTKLELVRSQSYSVRLLNLISNLRQSIERIGGKFIGVGVNKSINIELPDGRRVLAFPTVGVPTSKNLQEASLVSDNQINAVIYDHVGISPGWVSHLEWLGVHIKPVRWVKSAEVAWQLADWEASK